MVTRDKRDYDAVVVGSGPNGLAAAIHLQQSGLSVLLVEGSHAIGGGLKSAELTLPGFIHDVCSAIHPMAAGSPFFSQLPLHEHGLSFIHPPIAAAHPFENGRVILLKHSVEETASSLAEDGKHYIKLVGEIVKSWADISNDVLAPLHFPSHPMSMAAFGLKAITSAEWLTKRFQTREAKAFFAGMAAHSIQPLSNLSTSAIALVLLTSAHVNGWPLPKGGSQSIADALSSYFISLGGKIETNCIVTSLGQLPSSHAVLFDVTPRQLLKIAGHTFSSLYRWQLERYRYGMGVFKIDWALDAPIPFKAAACQEAGTVHLGDSIEEISESEKRAANGMISDKPFVLVAQQSLFDDTRAPLGKHTGWAYCHVPHASRQDMTEIIERQVERYAPGFRERIIGRHTMNTEQMESYNPNYIGGDIGGGVIDLGQLFTRPALRFSPYKTSAKGIYICSSSTPPGGGVHGMCGYYAAKRVLKDMKV
jgi:phytoene dehydrogenase-like protein